MDAKKLDNYFFLKDNIVLGPVIELDIKKARKQLTFQHCCVNASGKEQLIHILKFQTYHSMAV